MQHLLRMVIGIVLIFTVAGGFLFWGDGGVLSPGQHEVDTVVVVPRQAGLREISQALTDGGVLAYPWTFLVAGVLLGKTHSMKPGEYRVPAKASPVEIAHLVASGQTITHTLTIPEGYTVYQIFELVQSNTRLEGETGDLPAEGTLLPESYHYKLWDKRADLVARMRKAMRQVVQKCWQGRDETVPVKSPEELVTLASIVEKETGVPHERREIAGVFVNRLREGMRLQADPTVIYGITQGKGALGRKLLRQDLQQDTPYNTYTNKGLPPSPIACPGKQSLWAAARPNTTPNLYFVADGTGGHTFSSNLKAHNARVKNWREIRRAKEKAEEESVTPPAPS